MLKYQRREELSGPGLGRLLENGTGKEKLKLTLSDRETLVQNLILALKIPQKLTFIDKSIFRFQNHSYIVISCNYSLSDYSSLTSTS